MTEAADLRGLVLDAALAQALRVIAAVRETGLTIASLREKVDVAGVRWHLTVTYDTDDTEVRLSGRPEPDPDDEQQIPPAIAAMFGIHSSGGFDWSMPCAWVETAAAVPREVRP